MGQGGEVGQLNCCQTSSCDKVAAGCTEPKARSLGKFMYCPSFSCWLKRHMLQPPLDTSARFPSSVLLWNSVVGTTFSENVARPRAYRPYIWPAYINLLAIPGIWLKMVRKCILVFKRNPTGESPLMSPSQLFAKIFFLPSEQFALRVAGTY